MGRIKDYYWDEICGDQNIADDEQRYRAEEEAFMVHTMMQAAEYAAESEEALEIFLRQYHKLTAENKGVSGE